jgi:hypothetical protein
MGETVSPMKGPVLNIPGDISLSRGVSERGLKWKTIYEYY